MLMQARLLEVLNTLCGALAAYGLAGLRYIAKHEA